MCFIFQFGGFFLPLLFLLVQLYNTESMEGKAVSNLFLFSCCLVHILSRWWCWKANKTKNKQRSIFFLFLYDSENRNSNFKTIYFLIYIGFTVTPTISLTKYVKWGNCNLYFYDALWHSHQTSLFTIYEQQKKITFPFLVIKFIKRCASPIWIYLTG